MGEDRVKISHFTQQGFRIDGIIQVGVNIGQEYPHYKEMGIENFLGFEAHPYSYCFFKRLYPEAMCFNLALGSDSGFRNFYEIGEGSRQQSSLLLPIGHYEVEKILKVPVVRFDQLLPLLVSFFGSALKNFNCLVIDVQGFELQVLQGFGSLLDSYIDLISVECSTTPHYHGEASVFTVIDYLSECGFIRDSPIVSHDDVFFVKKNIQINTAQVYKGLV